MFLLISVAVVLVAVRVLAVAGQAATVKKNMLRQPYILQIYHLESNVSVLNLVTLSL
jgi:hypothetical protein